MKYSVDAVNKMKVDKDSIKQILCESLIQKATEYNREILSMCTCKEQTLAEAIECSIKVTPIAEDRYDELLTTDGYYKGYHITYWMYYPPFSNGIEFNAGIYLSELEEREK